MKKKFFDVKTAVAPAFCFMIIVSLCGCAVNKEYVSDDYSSQPTYGDVHMISMDSDDKESSYKVGAALPSTEFSSVGRMLEDKVTQEWKTYDEMTKEEILLSSHLYGLINFETDTWKELEEAIGFSVYNPLEALSLLNKTGHIGTESAEPITPMKHIEVIADTANAERKLREIRATSGYSTGNVRITLTATLSSEEGMYGLRHSCIDRYF